MPRLVVSLNRSHRLRFVLSVLPILFVCSLEAEAQNDETVKTREIPVVSAPFYAEVLFGSDRSDLQLEINRRFSQANHRSLISITSAQGKHSNSTDSFDFVNASELSWDLMKGFGVNVGLSLNRQVGFNYTAGCQYVRSSSSLLVVASPSVLLTGDHDIQNVLLVRYGPTISARWRLFEGVQILDDYDLKTGIHPRQFLHARSGATIETFTFGVGADADW